MLVYQKITFDSSYCIKTIYHLTTLENASKRSFIMYCIPGEFRKMRGYPRLRGKKSVLHAKIVKAYSKNSSLGVV